MVPLVQQGWAEVKRLDLGTVGKSVSEAGEGVVEWRLKGTGMHWACRHVKPTLALLTLDCSDRWLEDWPQITQRMRQHA